MNNEVLKQGKFGQNLMRSNKQLREDRGVQIAKSTAKIYKRQMEDLQEDLENLIIDRDNALDINPGNTQTIINPSDFDSKSFVQKDLDMGLKIREIRIKLEEAKKRYADLFGGPEETTNDETTEV